MSIITLGNLRTHLRRVVKERQGTDIDGYIDRCANLTVKDIWRRTKLMPQFQKTTSFAVTQVSEYTLYSFESDLYKLMKMYIPSEGITLDLKSHTDFRNDTPKADATGTPTIYIPFGTTTAAGITYYQFYLYPYADKSLTIHYDYIKNPTAMSSTSAVPELPESFENVYINGVLKNIYKYQDDSRYQEQNAEYENELDALLDDIGVSAETEEGGFAPAE